MLVFNAETVAVLMGMLPPPRRRRHSPDTPQHTLPGHSLGMLLIHDVRNPASVAERLNVDTS